MQESFEIISDIDSLEIKSDYEYTAWGQSSDHLMVSSKGGSGHITAMMALLELYTSDKLPLHQPRLYENVPRSGDGLGIFFISQFQVFRDALKRLGIIAIPSYSILKDAIEKMNDPNPRYFVDTLRDISPIGYEAAVIWDELQRQDKHKMLARLIELQPMNDKMYHQVFYSYFFEKLVAASQEGRPFSKIISTQVIGLPAMCDAVIAYNEMVYRDEANSFPQVVIEQFMTDLPTVGAVHFFSALKSLSPKQQQQMNLHAVNLTVDVLMKCLGYNIHFSNLYRIDPKHNPMVRKSFKETDNSTRFEQDLTLVMKNGEPLEIKAGEKIASIMLSGQGSDDTSRYIMLLLEANIDKVFVFGGGNPTIKTKIVDLLCYEAYAGRIILLPNQDADFIAALTSRCLVEVIRGGGLTVMEKLAAAHHPSKHIFIHYSNASLGTYKSGIAWEDSNANELIDYLGQRGLHVQKTCPMEFNEHLRLALRLEILVEDKCLLI